MFKGQNCACFRPGHHSNTKNWSVLPLLIKVESTWESTKVKFQNLRQIFPSSSINRNWKALLFLLGLFTAKSSSKLSMYVSEQQKDQMWKNYASIQIYNNLNDNEVKSPEVLICYFHFLVDAKISQKLDITVKTLGQLFPWLTVLILSPNSGFQDDQHYSLVPNRLRVPSELIWFSITSSKSRIRKNTLDLTWFLKCLFRVFLIGKKKK